MQLDNSQAQLLEIQRSNLDRAEIDSPTKTEIESLPEPVQRNIATIIQIETEHALKINLLTEQKIIKIITLLEELRTDSPNIRDRQDLEVTEMQQPIDPQSLLIAIKESLNPEESPEPQIADLIEL